MRRQTIDWKKIIVNYIPYYDFVCIQHIQNISKFNNKKITQKWAKNFNSQLEIKAIMKYHYISIRTVEM